MEPDILNLKDPEVKAAMKRARKQIHDAQEDILQQLSVAMKFPEFRDRLREKHPDMPEELLAKRETPGRKGKSEFTKPKIDVPEKRKKNKAASKARKKGK